MKKLVLLVFALNICLGTFAQFTPEDTLKYRISLKDKAATDYSLQKPEMYLSKKSIERRKRQGLEIDSTDLPVCKKYVDAIRKKGVHVLVTGKWDNFVTVSCNDSMLIAEIAGLPFVRSTERVWRGVAKRASERDSLINKPLRTDSLYGPAITQIKMSHADRLHEAGFKGQGMTIAVIDAGFHNVDKIEAMKNINIINLIIYEIHDIFKMILGENKRIYVPGREVLTDQNNSKYEQQHSGDSFPEMMKERGLCKKGEGNELLKNIAYHLPDLLYFGYH